MLFILPPIGSIIQPVTSIIDVMAVSVVMVSIMQSIKPFLNYSIGSTFTSPLHPQKKEEEQQEGMILKSYKLKKKSFVGGLLFALELESANTILKMGIFTASFTQGVEGNNSGIENFLFFVIIITIRIIISQALNRLS